MLESMIDYPTPTRAEVSDISIAVREGTDAVMSGAEACDGGFPTRKVQVMEYSFHSFPPPWGLADFFSFSFLQATVAERTERALERIEGMARFGSANSEPITWIEGNDGRGMSEVLARTQPRWPTRSRWPCGGVHEEGNMPRLVSHYRPKSVVFAFCENEATQRNLNLFNGIVPCLKFTQDKEETFKRALDLLKERGHVEDVGEWILNGQSGTRPIWRVAGSHTIQVITVE